MVSRVDRAQQALLERMSGHSISSIKRFKYIPYLAMEVDAAALEALDSDPGVVSIEEDKLLKPKLEESIPLVGAPQAWSQGFGGSGQTIAILDTGVDKTHRFLAGKVVSEACYSGSGKGQSLCPGGVSQSTGSGSGLPCSDPGLSRCFHGTHMAGIAAGRGPDFSGVARDASLISVQVFSKYEPDDCPDEEEEEEESDEPCMRSSLTDQISGLERVLELSDRFDVASVNLSLGTVETFPAVCDNFSPSYKAIVDKLRAVGIAAVSSSGNEESSTGINFPGCISSVVSVGSTDDGSSGRDGSETKRDEVSDFSNSSPELDLLAPGRWITSSYPDNYFATTSGTSLAVPHVAGAWAVLKSKAPNASVEQVLSALKTTGDVHHRLAEQRHETPHPGRCRLECVLESQPRYTYTSGTSLTLTASPNSGFLFKSWRGCDSVSGNRCTVGVSAAKNVTALFESVAGQGPLQPPYQLTATPLGPHRIRLNWRDDNGGNATGFRIERQNQGGDWGLLVGLEGTRREFVDGSVDPEHSYSYRMYAYDQDGNVSDWSKVVTAATTPLTAGGSLTSRRWVIPTTANVPGRFGGIFKTNLTLANLSEEDIEVTARLFGTRGLVQEETISLEAVTYHSWNNFLDSLFGYRGAGAVEFTAEKPFQVASVEVFIDTSSGRNTTVVLNQPTPPLRLFRIGHQPRRQRERRQADQHRGVQQFEPEPDGHCQNPFRRERRRPRAGHPVRSSGQGLFAEVRLGPGGERSHQVVNPPGSLLVRCERGQQLQRRHTHLSDSAGIAGNHWLRIPLSSRKASSLHRRKDTFFAICSQDPGCEQGAKVSFSTPFLQLGMLGSENDVSRSCFILGKTQNVSHIGRVQDNGRMSRKQDLGLVHRGKGVINGRHRSG